MWKILCRFLSLYSTVTLPALLWSCTLTEVSQHSAPRWPVQLMFRWLLLEHVMELLCFVLQMCTELFGLYMILWTWGSVFFFLTCLSFGTSACIKHLWLEMFRRFFFLIHCRIKARWTSFPHLRNDLMIHYLRIMPNMWPKSKQNSNLIATNSALPEQW